MLYSLTENGSFSETIPVGTDAGDYTVYYKVSGDEHHYDSEVYGPVTAVIRKAELTSATLSSEFLFYTGEPQSVVVLEVKAGDLIVPKGSYQVIGNTVTELGEHTVVITAEEDSNFQGQITVTFQMLLFTGYYYDYDDTTTIWYKGSGKNAIFHVFRADLDELTYRLFRRIEVDDRIVSPSNYEKTEGSIIISLKNSCLETLDVGWHKLTTVFNDGEVATDFLVVPQDYDGRTYPNPYPNITGYTYVNPTNNPRTGDESNISLWVALAVISALTVLSGLTLLLHRRRRKMGNR